MAGTVIALPTLTFTDRMTVNLGSFDFIECLDVGRIIPGTGR